MNILAIESSCDETAVAIIRDGTEIVSNVVASSTLMHEKWGGIVPEVAAREQLTSIIPVVTEALSCYSSSEVEYQPVFDEARSVRSSSDEEFSLRSNDIKSIIQKHIDAIAVTVGPGLIGSLLIGVETAKTLAFVTGKPIIPVNHVLAHMYANFLQSNNHSSSEVEYQPVFDEARSTKNTSNEKFSPPAGGSNNKTIEFPAISLVVSGGHTELFLMKNEKELKWLGGTIDDAAGEAFDKTARLLGFGSRGGLAIQEAAKQCTMNNAQCIIKLPRPLMHDGTLNFSFSGLKTAILREVNTLQINKQFNNVATLRLRPSSEASTELSRTSSGLRSGQVQQLSFEVQEAITDVLVSKTLKAAELHNAKSILISGGVASNLRLRQKFTQQLTTQNSCLPAGTAQLATHFPPIEFCTDNAAYIGSYAYFRGVPVDWHDITAVPDLSVEV
jgi:N6-L-threonylcarbamoyladenine synthase